MDFLQVIETGSKEECEKALAKRLELNSSFFKKHYPKIYPLLTRTPSNYQLYVGDDGINIYNMNNKNFVYPKKDGRHSFVDISKQFATNPLNNPLWRLSNNDIYINKMEKDRFEQSAFIQNKIVDIGLKNEDLHKGVLHLPSNMLPVTTLFGLGGGLYLEYLQNSFEYMHSLLIFEESHDFFRISCCFVDYPALFKRMGKESLYFFIEDIVDRKIIKTFFTKRRLTSNYIRLELSLYSTPKIEEVKNIVKLEQYSNGRGWGTYEDEMIGVRNSKRNLSFKDGQLKYPILSNPKKLNYPICVVGNGPSLDDLMPFLQQNKNSMIIISCGTALKPLRNHGIKPDFQLEIERLPFLKKVLEDSEIDDIPIIGANVVDSSTLEASKEAYIFMRGSSAPTYLKKPRFTLEHSFPFVGNAGLSFALEFASSVYLVGLDMGYKKGRSKHAKNSFYGDEDTLLPKDAVKTEGNFSDDIYSTPLFSLSREVAELAIGLSGNKSVYNLSDGAYIKGAKPLKETKKLKKIDKETAVKRVKSCFCSDSSNLKDIEDDFEKKSFKEYKEGLFKILKREVKSKKELYALLDDAYNFVEEYKKKNRAFGILLNGSVSHILLSMFVVIMHIKRDNIGSIYSRLVAVFEEGFELFESKYFFSSIFANMEQ
jgi:hypothetical protein